jgi:hypothetical protein
MELCIKVKVEGYCIVILGFFHTKKNTIKLEYARYLLNFIY